jgi:hypothetical protein
MGRQGRSAAVATAKTGFVDAEPNPNQIFRPSGGVTTWSDRIVCKQLSLAQLRVAQHFKYGLAAET